MPIVIGATVTKTGLSGTVTSGGVAQTIAPARQARAGFTIQNISSGDLWFRFGGTAAASQPSFKLISGASYDEPAHGISSGAISVFGATTGQAFTAEEW